MDNATHSGPSNNEITSALKPLYELLADVVTTAMERVVGGVARLGVPRPVERANDMHRAIRECMRSVCDQCPDWLELVEEPDGVGMDYVVVDASLGGSSFAMRWGRIKDGKISRSGSKRSVATLSTGFLFDVDLEVSCDGLPMVTLAHTIEDDYTEVGIPQWWIGRISLIREWLDSSQLIEDVARFEKPQRPDVHEYDAPLVRSRGLDDARWGHMIDRLRAG